MKDNRAPRKEYPVSGKEQRVNIDQSIINACIKRDAKAEYALYRHCFGLLMPVCYRYVKNEDDAADLLNKGFLKILNNLEKYDPEKPFTTWIRKVMVNTIIDEFRAAKHYREMISPEDMSELGYQHHPVDFNEAEDRLSEKELRGYIARLPEASRVVLNLYVFEGLSHKEIAEKLNITEGTSKWHLSNARTLLRKILGDLFPSFKIHVI